MVLMHPSLQAEQPVRMDWWPEEQVEMVVVQVQDLAAVVADFLPMEQPEQGLQTIMENHSYMVALAVLGITTILADLVVVVPDGLPVGMAAAAEDIPVVVPVVLNPIAAVAAVALLMLEQTR